MEVERIEIVKDWLEPKLVYNIQVFLGFTNFYRQFIQSFSKIAASLTSMLKITWSSNKPASGKKNHSRLAFSKNDGN